LELSTDRGLNRGRVLERPARKASSKADSKALICVTERPGSAPGRRDHQASRSRPPATLESGRSASRALDARLVPIDSPQQIAQHKCKRFHAL